MSYLDKIRNRILNKGNSYGEDMEILDDKKLHKTILHRGCTSRFRESELIDSVSNCLEKRNIEFSILSDETCCGVMLFLLEDIESGKKALNKNLEKFKKHGVERIITIMAVTDLLKAPKHMVMILRHIPKPLMNMTI